MIPLILSPKSRRAVAAAVLTVFVISACLFSLPLPASEPAVTPVGLTQVVTRLVTEDATREVTRVVEVPVTVTPLPTMEATATPVPSTPDATGLPLTALPDYTDCLYGPAAWYVYKTSFPAGHWVEVVGRSPDAAWLNIEEVGGWNSCWIQASQAQLQRGRVEDLPVVTTMLPRSVLEFGSPSAAARRNGDQVTVSWKAVYMSADEVQGYLIDAFICKGGQLVQQPVFVPVTYAENVGTISVKITDEAGCADPSSAHIVSYGRRGFAEWEKIFWPPH